MSTALLTPRLPRLIEVMPGASMLPSTHKYYAADGTEMQASVTQRIKTDIVPGEFKSREMSQAVFGLCQRMRHAPNAPWSDKQRTSYRRWGHCRSAEEIADAWEANRNNGTYVHQTIEYLIRGVCTLGEKRALAPEIRIFRTFYEWFTKRYEIIAVEATLVMPEISTGGTIDAVAHEIGTDPDDVVLLDWKAMAAVVYERDKGVCNYYDLPQCKKSAQEVQMNMYASMYEAQTKKHVRRMLVVYIDVAEDYWEWLDVERRADETAAYFEALRYTVFLPPAPEPLLVQADAVKPLRVR